MKVLTPLIRKTSTCLTLLLQGLLSRLLLPSALLT
jgi:hypothetical protein